MIYLDNSATTQPSKVCVDTMTELLTCAWVQTMRFAS